MSADIPDRSSAARLAVWFTAAAASFAAAAVIVRYPTPIDAALPFIVVVIVAVAFVTHPAVQLAVPLLLAGEIALADEQQRLLWFGIVVGVALAAATVAARSRSGAAVAITIAAVLLLRWIPLDQVMIGRELFILSIAALIVIVLGSTPLAVAIAIATALFTIAVPLRTLIMPLGVLVIAATARFVGGHRVRLPGLSATAVALMMTFFAWSGVFARALPVMLGGGPARSERVPLHIAVPPGESAEVDVPRGARGLILSGANVPRLREGTLLGTIQPGNVAVRIGDVADWGVFRREHYYGGRNPLPRDPAGAVHGYGQTAWIYGSGRVQVPPGRIRVTADRRLPPDARLQIDAIELSQ